MSDDIRQVEIRQENAEHEGDVYMEAVARALVRAKELFERAPYLAKAEYNVGGCGLLTFQDLYVMQDFARTRFNDNQ